MTRVSTAPRAIRDDVAAGRLSAVDVVPRRARPHRRASTPRSTPSTWSPASARSRGPRSIDRPRAAGDALGPLAGVPIALKDNMCVRGMRDDRLVEDPRRASCRPTTRPSSTRLEAAGAVIVGKTNCDEFAMGSSNENSAFGPVRNPWAHRSHARRIERRLGRRRRRAAACRSRSAPTPADRSASRPRSAASSGSKPTYGRVSRYGLLAFASSLDQIGPFTRTVGGRGARAVGARRRRSDGLDRRRAKPVPDFTAALTGDVRGVRIGVPRAFVVRGRRRRACARAFDAALDDAARRGRDARRHRPAARAATRSRSTTWSAPPRRARISRATTA